MIMLSSLIKIIILELSNYFKGIIVIKLIWGYIIDIFNLTCDQIRNI